MERVEEVAVFLIKAIEHIQEAPAALAVVRGHVCDHQRAIDRVLVADIAAGEVAIAFLEAEDVPIRFPVLLKKPDLLSDILEAGEDLAHLYAIALSDTRGHIRRDYRLYSHWGLWHDPKLLAPSGNPIQEEHSSLVSRQEGVIARLVRDRDADPV